MLNIAPFQINVSHTYQCQCHRLMQQHQFMSTCKSQLLLVLYVYCMFASFDLLSIDDVHAATTLTVGERPEQSFVTQHYPGGDTCDLTGEPRDVVVGAFCRFSLCIFFIDAT